MNNKFRMEETKEILGFTEIVRTLRWARKGEKITLECLGEDYNKL